jgi:hypothetical protein
VLINPAELVLFYTGSDNILFNTTIATAIVARGVENSQIVLLKVGVWLSGKAREAAERSYGKLTCYLVPQRRSRNQMIYAFLFS